MMPRGWSRLRIDASQSAEAGWRTEALDGAVRPQPVSRRSAGWSFEDDPLMRSVRTFTAAPATVGQKSETPLRRGPVAVLSRLPGAEGRNRTADTTIFSRVLYL